MTAYELSRTEIIPMFDENGIIMNMRQFEYKIKVIGKEGEPLKQIENELDEAFIKQRKKASDTLPMIKVREKQIAFLLSEIKKMNPEQYKIIVAKAKKISDN